MSSSLPPLMGPKFFCLLMHREQQRPSSKHPISFSNHKNLYHRFNIASIKTGHPSVAVNNFLNKLKLMGSLVAGAALGTAFDLLFKSAFQTTQNVALFSSQLNRLISTLCLIKLAMDDVDGFNLTLNRTQHETQIFADRLVKGDKLLRKCGKVKRWNVFKKLYYSIKLSNLEQSLARVIQLDLAALHFRESKRMSVVVSNIEDKIDDLTSIVVSNIEDKIDDLTSIVVSNIEDKINELTSILHTSQIVRRSSNSFSKIVAGFEDGGNAGGGEITEMIDE